MQPLSSRNSPFHSPLSRAMFSRFNMHKCRRLSHSPFPPSPLPAHLIENSSISPRSVSNPSTLFLFASFSNTRDGNLKFDGHHSSSGLLMCHYCLKIPQVFVCVCVVLCCVVFAVPSMRCLHVQQYTLTPGSEAFFRTQGGKEIPRHLQHPRIYFSVHRFLPRGLILSEVRPAYSFIPVL